MAAEPLNKHHFRFDLSQLTESGTQVLNGCWEDYISAKTGGRENAAKSKSLK
jgi:hypothetical protein